jgi:hypothetical protein
MMQGYALLPNKTGLNRKDGGVMDSNSTRQMNKTEMFVKVAEHLLQQRAKSEADSGGCQYRGRYGRKCAVGILITDECYTAEIEGCGLAPLARDDFMGMTRSRRARFAVLRDALICSGVPIDPETLTFLNQLQKIHDCTPPERWAQGLRWFALFHDIAIPAIDAQLGPDILG